MYCAPFYVTTNVSTIMECVGAQDEQSCMPNGYSQTSGPPTCLWRKGIVRAENTVVDPNNKALFETNFCHPIKGANFEYDYARCIAFQNEQSCEQSECSWSTLQEFTPSSVEISMMNDTDMCLPIDYPQSGADFSECTQKNSSANPCVGSCKWYNLLDYQYINLPA
jgi:hypothetical protein